MMKALLNIQKYKTKFNAFSIVEIVVVIGAFSLVFASVSIFAIDAVRFTENNRQRINAAFVIQEEINAIILNKQDLWATMIENTAAGDKHIVYATNQYTIVDGPKQDGDIALMFDIESVSRDGSGNIVSSGGTEDINTRKINFTASWTGALGEAMQVNSEIYVTNWNTPNWHEYTETDFLSGTFSGTISTSTNGGAVELDLEDEITPDWCLPFLTATTYNMLRQGVPTSISAVANEAYLGTGQNASGPGFDHVGISSDNPPVFTQLEKYSNLDKVNDIQGIGDYVFVAADSNDKEVSILDISVSPVVEVGYFDAPGPVDADAVWVDGTAGFITQGDQLISFDMTSYTGSRPLLDTFTLAKNGTDLIVKNGYAYIGIAGGAIEMQIINVQNPSDLQASGTADVNNQSGIALHVREDTNRVYLATNGSSSEQEVFIINTSSKSSSRPIIKSIDTNGMNPKDISMIEDRIIVVGQNAEEYQVFDITAENSPFQCGGLQNDFGLFGVETVVDIENNAWSYTLTGNSDGELMVILGGEFGGGGGGGQGSQYLEYGEYTSSVFDTGVASPIYYSISWDEILYPNTDLRIQVRSGNSSNLSGEAWKGPDGTASTYFTNPEGEYLPTSINGRQYIQYKVYFNSDKVNTAVLYSIKINYQD